MVQTGVMGITALVIAFVYQWKLTLLIIAFVPFLMAGGAMHMKMMTSFASEENERLVDAGAVSVLMNSHQILTHCFKGAGSCNVNKLLSKRRFCCIYF